MVWSDFFKGVVDVGKALLGGAAKAATTIIHEAKEFVDKVWDVAHRSFRGDPESEKERLERNLQDVNERVQRLRKRYQKSNDLTSTEKREWIHLKGQRDEINAKLREVEQGTNAEEIVKGQKDYGSAEITDDTSHILQYHVGQSTFAKICKCGRTMVLQWDRTIAAPGIKDFFWGCSGFYLWRDGKRACKLIKPLENGDLNLFGNLI